MRIVYIVPGSGNTFYCQNCFRDLLVVKGLRSLGHDVIMVPMYLPLFEDDGQAVATAPVFYGAVSLYLKHRFPVLAKFPRAMLRWLDAAPMLRFAARKAGSTRARGHEDMTLSMLRGEQGRQATELDGLATWLETQLPLDVIHLSNALLLGLAGALRRRLNAAVVCSLQDEDTWVDAMAEPDARRLWAAMAEDAAKVTTFVSVSRYYAGLMASRMQLPPEHIRVVPIGIDVDAYPATRRPECATVGFLSRIAAPEGFGLLSDAVLLLKDDPRLRAVRLVATGGHTGDDHMFIDGIRRKWRARGCGDDLIIQAAFDRPSRLDFLQGLTVLSVPALKGEAFGTYLLEAMACGVPVVQPRLGAFPEIIEATGGGVVYEPNRADALAAALRDLLLDPDRIEALGRRGRESVHANYSVARSCATLADLYSKAAKSSGAKTQ